MTSSNGSIFRVTGLLCGEFTGHRWIPHTKANDSELWCFLWSAPKKNSSANKRDAGNLRRHCAHFDVIVMHGLIICCYCLQFQTYLRVERYHSNRQLDLGFFIKIWAFNFFIFKQIHIEYGLNRIVQFVSLNLGSVPILIGKSVLSQPI